MQHKDFFERFPSLKGKGWDDDETLFDIKDVDECCIDKQIVKTDYVSKQRIKEVLEKYDLDFYTYYQIYKALRLK